MRSQLDEQTRVHAIVHGRVQGVSFRFFTQRTAEELRLTGWVRNRRDGTVEAVAEGPLAQIGRFVSFLHRGSPSAQVAHVDVRYSQPTGEFSGFFIRYDLD